MILYRHNKQCKFFESIAVYLVDLLTNTLQAKGFITGAWNYECVKSLHLSRELLVLKPGLVVVRHILAINH